MVNLIRMDLYRMRKNKSFLIILILAALISFAQAPVLKLLTILMTSLAKVNGDSAPEGLLAPSVTLVELLEDPFPVLTCMLTLISVSGFFYADIANGYIKNIAGQMPKKGYTVLSKFIASIAHNLLFMTVCVAMNLLGSVLFQKVTIGSGLVSAIGIFLLKLALLQAITSIILFFTTALKNKSLGTVAAVLMGTGLLFIAYMTIDGLIGQIFHTDFTFLQTYMPDQLIGDTEPKVLDSILSSAVTILLFLILSIQIFDRRDVK